MSAVQAPQAQGDAHVKKLRDIARRAKQLYGSNGLLSSCVRPCSYSDNVTIYPRTTDTLEVQI